jgi:hypothetical protein
VSAATAPRRQVGQRLLLTAAMLVVAGLALHRAYGELRLRWLEQEVVHAEAGLRSGRAIDETAAAQILAEHGARSGAIEHELRARMQVLLARQSKVAADRVHLYRAARDHLRAAAVLRPSSPYVWSELAEAKARAGSFDGEFRQAFERALALGPQEPRVLRQLLGVALRDPDRLGSSLDAEIDALVRHYGYHDAARLFELASRYHRAGWLCARADLNTGTARICAQRGFDPNSGTTP